MPARVLLVGGSSEIGCAIVGRLGADRPVEAHLLGRDRARLDDAAALLARSGCSVGAAELFEAADLAGHEPLINAAFARAGGFDTVILAVGILGGQAGLEAPPTEAVEVMSVDFTACGSL